MHFYFQNKHKSKMVDNPIHHGGYFNPPWWILEFTKFTCFILMICIFIFQQTQKQDGGYLNPQNKWNVGSDAFIIAQNINHKRERGVLLKATLFILTKLKMIDPYRHWRTSTDFTIYVQSLSYLHLLWRQNTESDQREIKGGIKFDVLTK